jgi:hypothetical protein
MPYYRRRYRPYRRRRRYRKQVGQSTTMALVNRIPSLIKSMALLKSMVNSELHSAVTATAGITPTTSGQLVCLNQIAQGDGSGNRQGISIKAHSLLMRSSVSIHASATHTYLRTVLLVDTDNQGADPTLNEIFQGTPDVYTPINENNLKRFRILRDSLTSLSQVGSDANKVSKDYVKLGFHVKFDGAASTDYQKNSIYLVHISSEATNTPTVAYNCRLRFYDN